jgi:hypothetical protein
MRGLLVLALGILLLAPLNHSIRADETDTGGVTMPDLPSRDDVVGCLFALERRIVNFDFRITGALDEHVIANLGVSVIGPVNGSDMLVEALCKLYGFHGIAYNESDVAIFVQNVSLPADVISTLALLLLAYAHMLENPSKQEQMESIFFLLSTIRRATPLLTNVTCNGTYVDPYDFVAVGGSEETVYDADYGIIIDFGGSDTYLPRNNSFVLDVKGNDTYESHQTWHGVTLLFDLDGCDTYHDTPVATNGLNLLFDQAGDDRYLGQSVASYQDGISLLVDWHGDDYYSGDQYTQCYAEEATSVLLDLMGNDIYDAYAHAQASSESGISLLVDCFGDDVFSAEMCSQAYATGFLRKGISLLVNLAGNDMYNANDFSQGYGEQGSVALIFDILGEDGYRAGYFSQAASASSGIAALVDAEGRNSFSASSFSQGYHQLFGQTLFLPHFDFEDAYEYLELLADLNLTIHEILSYLLQRYLG